MESSELIEIISFLQYLKEPAELMQGSTLKVIGEFIEGTRCLIFSKLLQHEPNNHEQVSFGSSLHFIY